MARRTREDRLALRQARLGGVALAHDEYEDSFDDLDNDDYEDSLPPLGSPKGDVSVLDVLADLLGALGIKVDASGGEDQFKRSLYAAALAKIRELTGNGNTGKNGNNGQRTPNPLMTSEGNSLLREESQPTDERQPMYMSLAERVAHIEGNVGDHRVRGAALAMAIDTDNMRRQQTEHARHSAQQQATALAKAHALRQSHINEILAMNPMPWVRHEVERILNAFGTNANAAFSMGPQGVHDHAATALLALKKQVSDQLARDRQCR